MNRFWKIFGFFALMVSACAVTFAVTYVEMTRASGLVTAKTGEISQYLDRYFIDDYDPQLLAQGAADGAAAGMIFATGDKWSYYMSAEEYQQHAAAASNDYVGIGITILEKKGVDGFEVQSVEAEAPAGKAGVLAGDILQKVEGESALKLGKTETVSRVRGEAGTKIQMTFLRAGKPYDVTIVRSDVQNVVAAYHLTDEKKAVIAIRNFDAHCAEQTIKAINRAVRDGAVGVVFDLRNNPGGLKTELVQVLDRLLPVGTLFRSKNYAGLEEVDESDPTFLNLPMVVLINEESYSAAEFFAAALQEYGTATIVGAQTSGKGNFQNVFQMSDGSAISISIGKYYTPKGVSLTDTGVTPDVVSQLSEEQFVQLYYRALAPADDPQLQAALATLTQKP